MKYNKFMKRYYIIYKGRVQGVGFRFKLYQIAYRYNLTGYCRNLSNGDVECEVQGSGVAQFLKESLAEEYFVRIDDYAIKEIDPIDDEETFKITY